jgi:transcriptional regulator GlxA family with amidase domain
MRRINGQHLVISIQFSGSRVALAAGFSDISQFNRLFRARFGDTPSAVRGQRRTKK